MSSASAGDRGKLDAAEGRAERAALEDPGAALERPADDPLLVLVREHDRGPERLEALAEAFRAEVADRAPGREVDAHLRRELGRPQRGGVDRGAEQRVAGQVQVRAAVEPGGIELLGAQVGRDAAVGGHRAGAVDADERDDRSGPARDDRAADVDPVAGEPGCGGPAGLVVGALADEASLAAQLADPRGDVRGLAAGPELRHRIGVGALGEGLREADDHVEQQVAERHDHA